MLESIKDLRKYTLINLLSQLMIHELMIGIYKCQFLYFDILKVNDDVFIKKWNHMVPLKKKMYIKYLSFCLQKGHFCLFFSFIIFIIRF